MAPSFHERQNMSQSDPVNLTLKITSASSRKEIALLLAKLALFVEAGADRGTIAGTSVLEDGTAAGRWNVSKGRAPVEEGDIPL